MILCSCHVLRFRFSDLDVNDYKVAGSTFQLLWCDDKLYVCSSTMESKG